MQYEAAGITDAVILDEDVGSLPYALYKRNRQAVTAMKYRGKTTVQGLGSDDSGPSSAANMEEQDNDESGNLSKKVRPNEPDTTNPLVQNTSSQNNTHSVVNTVMPSTDHIFQSNSDDFPVLSSPEDLAYQNALVDKNVHSLLDNLDMQGVISTPSILIPYDFARRVVRGDPDALNELKHSKYPQYDRAMAYLIYDPNLKNFLTAYESCPDGEMLAKSVLADIVMDAIKEGIKDEDIDRILVKFFAFMQRDGDIGELNWVDWLEKEQLLQYDYATSTIVWPHHNQTSSIFTGEGGSAYINPAKSASS